MSDTDPTKKPGVISGVGKGKHFLLLIRQPPCYSYIQARPVKFMAVIKERKHLRKK
jgi:hypothetical protein